MGCMIAQDLYSSVQKIQESKKASHAHEVSDFVDIPLGNPASSTQEDKKNTKQEPTLSKPKLQKKQPITSWSCKGSCNVQ